MQKLRTMQRLRSDVNSAVYMSEENTYLTSRLGGRYLDQPRVKEHYRFKSLYYRAICRALKTHSLPEGDKLKMLGASSWDEAVTMLKSIPGYQENLARSAMRLELIDGSLPFPSCVHISNLRYGKIHGPKKLRKVKEGRIREDRLTEVVEVIDLTIREAGNRICAKKLHDIVRKALDIHTNVAIVDVIRAVMAARGWKAWQTYDECWYEKL